MRLIKLPKHRTERGDTIVEVLIAVGIVSTVLVGAYAITNRNIQSGQSAQEQGYAQKLVQQQVELLRAATDRPTDGGCLDTTGTKAPVGSALCKQTVGGATYTLSVILQGTVYAIDAHWDVLGGGSADTTMYYKVVQ